MTDKTDPIDEINPRHYQTEGGLEAIDVIEAFGYAANHYRANALKYILRAGRKGDAATDLQKCIWYIQREIKNGTPRG